MPAGRGTGSGKLRRIGAAAGFALVAACGAACAADELRNWFGDPFFAISASLPDCPLPAGPFISEAEQRVQSHHRAERGTTCWLAGQCDRPNAYAYDADIAAALQRAVGDGRAFADSSLWATVQGRIVYIEGCASAATAAEAQALARSVPNVQQAIAIVRTDPAARPPYKLR
jgi:hypothetical protein